MLDLIEKNSFISLWECAALLGAAAGILGVFAAVKKQGFAIGSSCGAAFIGAMISSAVWKEGNDIITLLFGLTFYILFYLFIRLSDEANINIKMKDELIFGIVISISLMIYTYLSQNDLISFYAYKFFLGETTVLHNHNIKTISYVCIAAIIIPLAFSGRFKAVFFSRDIARSSGIKPLFYELAIFMLTACIAAIGMHTIGILIMGAFFIIPALIAKMWVKSFLMTLITAGITGGLGGALGGLAAGYKRNLSSGTAILAIIGSILILSLIFAPKKGIIYNFIRK